MNITNRVKNYTLFILLISIPISLLILFLAHLGCGSIPHWLFDLIFPLFFTNQLASSMSAAPKLLDMLAPEKTTDPSLWQRLKQHSPFEFAGILLSIGIAIAVTVAEIVLHVPLHAIVFPHCNLSTVVEFCFNIELSSIWHHTGSIVDCVRNNSHLLTNEKIGTLGGVLAGVMLSTVVLAVVGTSVASMGTVVPLWIACGLFVMGTMSTTTSIGSHVGRCVGGPLNFEKGLMLAGMIGGVILASTLIACGIATLPFFGAGAPAAVGGIFLFLTCISGFTGFGKYLGSVVDKVRNQTKEKEEPKPTQCKSSWFSRRINHGVEEDRTPDLHVANVTLSQLSYNP